MQECEICAKVVGQVIQGLRAGKFTQAALARHAGISQSALSRFENGQSMPDVHELRLLAAVLRLAPMVIMELIEMVYVHTRVVAKVSSQQPWEQIEPAAMTALVMLAAVKVLEGLPALENSSVEAKASGDRY